MRQRRLGDVERDGRGGESAVLDDGDEVFQLASFHRLSVGSPCLPVRARGAWPVARGGNSVRDAVRPPRTAYAKGPAPEKVPPPVTSAGAGLACPCVLRVLTAGGRATPAG